jgi:hypothetical protein
MEQTPQQRYRQTEKCREARRRYYESKGREKAAAYYIANKETILARAKERYNDRKATTIFTEEGNTT